jgi:hypothetical protein
MVDGKVALRRLRKNSRGRLSSLSRHPRRGRDVDDAGLAEKIPGQGSGFCGFDFFSCLARPDMNVRAIFTASAEADWKVACVGVAGEFISWRGLSLEIARFESLFLICLKVHQRKEFGIFLIYLADL